MKRCTVNIFMLGYVKRIVLGCRSRVVMRDSIRIPASPVDTAFQQSLSHRHECLTIHLIESTSLQLISIMYLDNHRQPYYV